MKESDLDTAVSRIFTAVVFSCMASATHADERLDRANTCIGAIQMNDKTTAKVIADEITQWQQFTGSELREKAETCVRFSLGEGWSYSFGQRRMVSVDEVRRLEAERITSNAQASAQNLQRLAAERARSADADAKSRQQELAEAEARLQAQLRAQRVAVAVDGACRELFFADRNSALTNSVCVEVFMETGLPAD